MSKRICDTSSSKGAPEIVEPFVIVVLAVIVGFIILSVMLPMFQIYNSI